MSWTPVNGGMARLLALALDHDFPERIAGWKEHLKEGRLTTEMRSVFDAMGYPVPRKRGGRKVGDPEEVSVETVLAQDPSFVRDETGPGPQEGTFRADELAPFEDHKRA